jgi:dTDP-4-amino-4,6-dideoxygalactose transaminase
MNAKPIQVTEPFLPPLDEYVEYLKGIWDRNHLTNGGPLVRELEQELQKYHDLNVPVYCVANGALGLQIALKALGVKGEIITTPFSYVATSSCPLWEGCSVKFADIEEESLTIDPNAVEDAITPQTEAILATHVFGNPSDVKALGRIAKKHHLALIYDAAHAFGVTYQGRSILEWGDASMVSMHATKLFHTVEGGFVVSPNSSISEKIEWMRRFGHKGPIDYSGVGINAKMSEIHAAMGLCNFNHISGILEQRKAVCRWYDAALNTGDSVRPYRGLEYRSGASRNYSYYPAIFESESKLLGVLAQLELAEIYPRRYFYPALHQLPRVQQTDDKCPVAESISKRILCLPLSHAMSDAEVEMVCECLG